MNAASYSRTPFAATFRNKLPCPHLHHLPNPPSASEVTADRRQIQCAPASHPSLVAFEHPPTQLYAPVTPANYEGDSLFRWAERDANIWRRHVATTPLYSRGSRLRQCHCTKRCELLTINTTHTKPKETSSARQHALPVKSNTVCICSTVFVVKPSRHEDDTRSPGSLW